MKIRHRIFGALAAGVLIAGTTAQSFSQVYLGAMFMDVPYATIEGKILSLDIILPREIKNPPLLVWIHGGAWRSGGKRSRPLLFSHEGFATASLDFRQSTEAKFPANVHDIKAAIRFLRANAKKFGYNAEKIAIAGSSSGGHLAALVGVTNGNTELEGNEGDYLTTSSDVQAIIDYFGASNLNTILSQSTPFGLGVREPALRLLLGAAPDSVKSLATLASPVSHIDAGDPPLLIFHGDQDPQMPINQSLELEGQYKKAGLDVHFEAVYGAAHGGDIFFSGVYEKLALEFLRKHLK